MRYRIAIRPAALKVLSGLPRKIQRRIGRVIDDLGEEPRPSGAKALQGRHGLLRVRVGDYRIVYQIDDDVLEVLIIRIGHRRDVYRGL